MDILIGLQYGDEGKGKIAHEISSNYDILARFNGGPNAGHTIYHNDEKIILHHLPCGIVNNKAAWLGAGMVINPVILSEEINSLIVLGLLDIKNIDQNIFISEYAHIITPINIFEDIIYSSIGTTKRGIGYAYSDKMKRLGIRMKDIYNLLSNDKVNLTKHFDFIFKDMIKIWNKHHSLLPYKAEWDIQDVYKKWIDSIYVLYDMIEQNIATDNSLLYHLHVVNKEKLLAEGAQGFMLDIDYGDYPFVTSSNTLAAYACVSLGIPVNKVDKVIGVAKFYTTRVGDGTALYNEDSAYCQKLQEVGNEVGATTGRRRKCGYLNFDELNRAIEINGVNTIYMTKLDIVQEIGECRYVYQDTPSKWVDSQLDFSSREGQLRLVSDTDNMLKRKINAIYFSLSPKDNCIKVR